MGHVLLDFLRGSYSILGIDIPPLTRLKISLRILAVIPGQLQTLTGTEALSGICDPMPEVTTVQYI